jgi:fumarate reductase subunit C
MSPYWYFDRWPYLKFILRESSSFFIAYFAVVILAQIGAVAAGPSAYADFQAWMGTPLILIVNLVAFVFVLLHALTWFALVPRVMVRQVTGKAMPDMMAAVPNYGVWLAASLIVALIALRII